MFNKKSTAGFILVFSFLFLFRQSSYSQGSPTISYEVLENCCGSSVPDTTEEEYVAMISTSRDNPKAQITFYRIYCKICCYLLKSRSGRQPFPEADKVTDRALIKKLRNALKKQLAYKTKLVHLSKD